MDLKDRMAELDARMAARRDALDKKLGLAPVEEQPAVSEPAPSASPDGPAPSGSDEAATAAEG